MAAMQGIGPAALGTPGWAYDGGAQAYVYEAGSESPAISDGDVIVAITLASQPTADGACPVSLTGITSGGGDWVQDINNSWHDTTLDGYFAWGLWHKVWSADTAHYKVQFNNTAIHGDFLVCVCQGVGAPTFHGPHFTGSFTGIAGSTHSVDHGDGSTIGWTEGGSDIYHTDLFTGYYSMGALTLLADILWQKPNFGPFLTRTPAGGASTDNLDGTASASGGDIGDYDMALWDYISATPIRFRGHIRVSR